MSPAVRISDANLEKLGEWAAPFKDTPNDALGNLMDAADKAGLRFSPKQTGSEVSGRRDANQTALAKRTRKRGRIPQEVYESFILMAMYELDGKAKVSEVLDRVEDKMAGILDRDYDYQRPPTGTEVRWRNTARWARAALVDRGLITRGSPRGIWELSEQGKTEAKAILASQGSG